MKPLQIPKRYRDAKMGMYIRCNHCKRNVTSKCVKSDMKLHTCKHGENHRFISKVWDQVKNRMALVKTWPQELRNFDEFLPLHLQAIKNYNQAPRTINSKPGLLTDCMNMYIDFLQDVGVPSYEKKNNSTKYISNQAKHLKDLKAALAHKNINADLLPISEMSEHHVEIIYDYLTTHYSNKSYNNKISLYRSMFKWLISREYPIKNIFENIKLKETEARTNIITIDQFNELLANTSTINGWKEEAKGGGRIGRKQMFREWLADVWTFTLHSGCRREEIAWFKVGDVTENHIVYRNLKASHKKNTEVLRLVLLTEELKAITDKLTAGRDPEEYLLAPEEINRVQFFRHTSNAFTHYWSKTHKNRAILHDLRNTYTTILIKQFGPDLAQILGNLHQDKVTTINNYLNKADLFKQNKGIKLFG